MSLYVAWGFLAFLCIGQSFVFYSAWPWSPYFQPCRMHLLVVFYYFGMSFLGVLVMSHLWWCFLAVPLSWITAWITFQLKYENPYNWVSNWIDFLFVLMVSWPIFFLLGFYVWLLTGWLVWLTWFKK